MSERPSLLKALVDLAVYAPVGLALSAAEELPELIAKGRSRIEPQLGAARLVGQFVVAEGRRRVTRFAGVGSVDTPAPSDGGASSEPGGRAGASAPSARAGSGGRTGRPERAYRPAQPASPSAGSPARTGASVEVPDVASLGIPGYDSLSASQVVQRLAGLSPGELAAVGRYEAANRGRRTILARVSQLQGD